MPYPSMTVYSASAGAGKTFTLAVRYIELLIENPTSFRETLAVTFTNKATDEMKLRILSQLYGLAHNLKDSRGYMNRIKKDLGKDEKFISDRAKHALQLIMHDYSHFSVQTIDAFFQHVLRNLARELELTANLRVELNDKEVESLAVDELISNLKTEDIVLKWVMDFINQNMDEEKNWNVISSIKDFGQMIFNDEYRKHAKELTAVLSDSATFDKFYKEMRTLAYNENGAEELRQRGEEFFKKLDANGYSADQFVGKSKGACSYFQKLRDLPTVREMDKKCLALSDITQKGILAAFDGAEGWTKEKAGSAIHDFVVSEAMPFLIETEKIRRAFRQKTLSAQVVLQHLNELRLLNHIDKKVREMNEEAGRFILGDTQRFLASLMRGDDAPFVYEKIGGRLKNIMIDEFQDTSTMQWQNFKKLLLDTLAQAESQSLIVGDVKQSIYRWRNGDWSTLHNMDHDTTITRYTYDHQTLKDNWRSDERVIKFNNEFFEKAAGVFSAYLKEKGCHTPELITDIYEADKLKQRVPDDKKNREDYKVRGHVDITLLHSKEDFNKACQERTAEILDELIAAGVKDEDIVILMRYKKAIPAMVDYLANEFPEHFFISSEAYLLKASKAVNIIINAMQVLVNTNDKLSMALLVKSYQEHVLRQKADMTLLRDDETTAKLLPEGFLERRQELLTMPLTDMAEEIASIFATKAGIDSEDSIFNQEAAYIFAFYDYLNNYTKKNIPSIEMFLVYWDEVMCNKAVNSGDLKGINVMSIHASKGLEFDHVIVPYCNWPLVYQGGETLWCDSNEEPFNTLPVIPVNTKGLKSTVYEEELLEETMQNCIDNLNLLYVAFTRAAKGLHIIGKNMSTKDGISKQNISGFIQETLPKLEDSLSGCVIMGNSDEEIRFCFGDEDEENDNDNDDDDVYIDENVMLRRGEAVNVSMNHNHAKIEFRQSNASRSFVASEVDDKADYYIEAGTIMHNVLSRIDTMKDIDRVLSEFEQEGLISCHSNSEKVMDAAKMSQFLKQRLTENSNKEVAHWFADDVEVLNECTIVFNDSSHILRERRPDRVVTDGDKTIIIDFKFGAEKEAHHRQVANYINLLQQMGMTNVEGRLWYVYNNEIKKVKA